MTTKNFFKKPIEKICSKNLIFTKYYTVHNETKNSLHYIRRLTNSKCIIIMTLRFLLV